MANWPPPSLPFVVRLPDDAPASFRDVISDDRKLQLRTGMVRRASRLWNWCKQAGSMSIDRQTVTIHLDGGATWTLSKAWPTSVQVADDDPKTREVVVQTIDLAYESLTVTPLDSGS